MSRTLFNRLLLSSLATLAIAVGACSDKPASPQASTASPSKATGHDAPENTPPKAAKKTRALFVDKGDLDAMQKRKVLRVLTLPAGETFLQQGGVDDRELVQVFAKEQGLDVEFHVENTLDGLFQKLEEGKGDLVAARITVTKDRKKRVAFARPTRVIDEVVVGRTDATVKSLADLAGKKLQVWKGSAQHSSLLAELDKAKVDATVEEAADGVDDEQLVQHVAQKDIDFTVVDSDTFAAAQTYTPGVKQLFVLNAGREIAWAVRKDNPKLKSAADHFILEKALTSHAQKTFTDDLDAIRKRGSIRLITRNNPVTYFLHRGQPRGFDYALAKLVAKKLKVRLEVVVPPDADQLIPWLNEGKGDFIAAAFTVTDDRKTAISFSTPYLFVDEVLVGKKGTAAAKDKAALKAVLSGKKVMVRPSSSYASTLKALHTELGGAFTIVDADESWETEEILAKVGKGEVDFTVADSHILAVEQTYSDAVVSVFALTQVAEGATDPKGKPRVGAKEIAFGVRQTNPQLKAFLDDFMRRTYRGLDYNVAKKQYFENKRRIRQAKAATADKGKVSPYDDIIKKYATKYGLDWRLMAAQAFQESRFNPKAKSWVGAKGLFQVMPATGKEMGFVDLENPEIGTHAGVKYMHKMIRQFDNKIPLKQRVRFALASYNAGRGHVLDAMRLARQQGLDPHKWFGNVEKTMLQLQDPKVAKRVRHGYCRGEEPVNYVSQIQLRYDNWVKLLEP